MKVYLDTALIRRIQDGRISSATRALIATTTHVTYVFSPSHLDDVILADEATDELLRKSLLSARKALYALPGFLIPQIEIAHLFRSGSTSGENIDLKPRILFDTVEEMVEVYPNKFEIRDACGQYEPYARMRADRAFRKELWAKNTQTVKQAQMSLRDRSPDRGQWLLKFLSTPASEHSPSEEEQWQRLRSQVSATAPEDFSLSDPVKIVDSLVAKRPTVERVAMEQILALLSQLRDAIRMDDRRLILPLLQAFETQAVKLQESLNPLGLSPAGKKFRFFCDFCNWLDESTRNQLFNDPRKLRRDFEQWLRSTNACPAGLIYREVQWQLLQDTRTPTEPSTETDLYHLALLPYVDVLFADKRIVHALIACSNVPQHFKDCCFRNQDFDHWVEENL